MVINTESGATMEKVASLGLKIAEMVESYGVKKFLSGKAGKTLFVRFGIGIRTVIMGIKLGSLLKSFPQLSPLPQNYSA